MTEHKYIDGYDELTVEEVTDRLDDGEFSVAQLEAMAAYEADHKDRVTVLRDIDRRVDEKTADDESDDAVATDDADEDEADEPKRVDVMKPDRQPGYAGGMWFETAFTRNTVEYTKRIQDAVDDGILEIVGDHDE